MKIYLLGILLCFSLVAQGQKSDKLPRYFGDPVIADSTSTLIIPVRYNTELLSSNKLALWQDFYSNIIFYDFTTDSYKKLFAEDTFIKGFTSTNQNVTHLSYNRGNARSSNMSADWVFYFVKPSDYNNNGKIDGDDPSILYVSDKAGNNLKALTPETENAVSIEILDKQGIAIIKMQRDTDKNRKFESKDKDLYYIRLDLKNLVFGKKIEINQ